MTTISAIVDRLSRFRFDVTDEARMQAGVERALCESGFQYRREHIIEPGSRIDFLVDRIGIELKITGTLPTVLAQLMRYAEHPAIGGLVLVTTRTTHLALPRTLREKPLAVHWQGGL